MAEEKRFSIFSQMKMWMNAKFGTGWADENKTAEAIREVWNKNTVLVDTHTAVAYSVYKESALKEPAVIVSTASPFKFAGSVLEALGGDTYGNAEESLHEFTGIDIPEKISGLSRKPVLHDTIISKEEMAAAVLEFISK